MALRRLQKYCAYQDRCHREVRSKLLELGIYGDDLEDIIVELIREDFLNEERFARSFARGKFRFKKWGRIRIVRELKLRDISAYCLKKALDEIDEAEYRRELTKLIDKKAGYVRVKDVFKKRKKLADFAIGKGFEPALVWEAVKEVVPDK
ncbi:MAG: RecX family transcriptional regulator [Bacteroidetes bacterium]|nr:MAG: RecX family transcriptional regulator [Bacteroidota bacterium]